MQEMEKDCDSCWNWRTFATHAVRGQNWRRNETSDAKGASEHACAPLVNVENHNDNMHAHVISGLPFSPTRNAEPGGRVWGGGNNKR
jgi:hypothetical protein